MSENIIYQYPGCSTCRKALSWLDQKKISFIPVHIVEETPDAAALKKLIETSGLPFRKFFNTSGKKYRELGLKDRIGTMTLDEAVTLLAGDGMLIKRPVMITGEDVLIGFREKDWEDKVL